MAGAGAAQSATPAGGEVLPRFETFLTPGTLETMLQELKVTTGSRIIFEDKNRRAQEMQDLETPKPKASCPDWTVTGYKPYSKVSSLLCGSFAPRVSFFIACFMRHWNLRNDTPGSPMTRWLQLPLCCEEPCEVLTGNTPAFFILLIIHFSYKIGCHPAYHESYLRAAKINVPKADFLKTTCQLTNQVFGLGEEYSGIPQGLPVYGPLPTVVTASPSGCTVLWLRLKIFFSFNTKPASGEMYDFF